MRRNFDQFFSWKIFKNYCCILYFVTCYYYYLCVFTSKILSGFSEMLTEDEKVEKTKKNKSVLKAFLKSVNVCPTQLKFFHKIFEPFNLLFQGSDLVERDKSFVNILTTIKATKWQFLGEKIGNFKVYWHNYCKIIKMHILWCTFS